MLKRKSLVYFSWREANQQLQDKFCRPKTFQKKPWELETWCNQFSYFYRTLHEQFSSTYHYISWYDVMICWRQLLRAGYDKKINSFHIPQKIMDITPWLCGQFSSDQFYSSWKYAFWLTQELRIQAFLTDFWISSPNFYCKFEHDLYKGVSLWIPLFPFSGFFWRSFVKKIPKAGNHLYFN